MNSWLTQCIINTDILILSRVEDLWKLNWKRTTARCTEETQQSSVLESVILNSRLKAVNRLDFL